MPAHFIQANTNGRLHPADEPSLTPLNRGFLYGDAIYEVWRSHHGVVFAWAEHLDRLQASARALAIDIPFSAEQIRWEIARTVAAFRAATGYVDDVYIRLQLTRGAGPIGLDIALADRPEFVLLVQPCPRISPEKLRIGLRLSIATSLRRNPIETLSPAWKTGNYLNNILCLREARARGADDVLILNLRGEIAEAAVSNVVFVRAGELVTPPLTAGILEGITRKRILETIAPRAGVVAREEVIRPEDLGAMEECFLLGTTRDLQSVSAVDGHSFRIGTGTVKERLSEVFADYTREYAAAHPELKM